MNQSKHKTIIVTGATSGIGKAVAIGLAYESHKLILACRNLEKAEKIKNEIISLSKNENIEIAYCDFSKLKTVVDFCQQYQNEPIDIICNCAGALFAKRQLTVDGFESNFSVNYLAPFLLTKLIIDAQTDYPVKIINLAGELHRRFQLNTDDLQYENHFHFIKAGSIGMLQRIMFTKSLIKHYPHVKAYSYHPGLIKTALLEELPFYFKYPSKLASPFFSSPATGADTALWLIKNEKSLENGAYYFKRSLKQPSKDALNPQLQSELWNKSIVLLNSYLT